MKTSKILIVEDEPVIALDIEQRLHSLGYEIAAIADSSESALQAANQTQPDLVLMDIHLSGNTNGITTSAYLRDQLHLPIVFLTAHSDPTTIKKVKATSPFGYLTKPFRTEDLGISIEIALSRYEAESTMRKELVHQEELSQLKSQLASVMSHEFRNPLGIILVTLRLLRQAADQIPPEKQASYFDQATAAVGRMNALLEDFLIFGEADNHKLCCHAAPVNVYEFCTELLEELRLTEGVHHNIQFQAPNRQVAGGDQTFSLDSRLLRHILINLLLNAIKYSPQNSDIHFDVYFEAEDITFCIRDHGIGIPLSDQPQLFSPFYRATNVGKVRGTGLGLSIVKQCVLAHHGQIIFDSEPGIGTKFTVTLPYIFDCLEKA
ncbi:MAG: ATP-binding protein [Elainella sp. Prado103]|jgi:signal transduction histidine kinase|nr:ATP-binding protein [Elainella sp. Prado103]